MSVVAAGNQAADGPESRRAEPRRRRGSNWNQPATLEPRRCGGPRHHAASEAAQNTTGQYQRRRNHRWRSRNAGAATVDLSRLPRYDGCLAWRSTSAASARHADRVSPDHAAVPRRPGVFVNRYCRSRRGYDAQRVDRCGVPGGTMNHGFPSRRAWAAPTNRTLQAQVGCQTEIPSHAMPRLRSRCSSGGPRSVAGGNADRCDFTTADEQRYSGNAASATAHLGRCAVSRDEETWPLA